MLAAQSIFSELKNYNINNVILFHGYVEVALASRKRSGVCPSCMCSSKSVHSHYLRTLAHVPVAQARVRLRLLTRRFRCHNAVCPQIIFAERSLDVGRPYARTTESYRLSLQRIGCVAGANAGERLASSMGLPTSATTLRRRILEAPMREHGPIRVLGVDDWAWRKGQRYGTILCDLEKGVIADILPDRSAESLAQWLREHPGAQIISRDRASCYAQGCRAGAPDAVQVADRWHLLHNMVEALERFLVKHYKQLKKTAKACSEAGDGSGQTNAKMAARAAEALTTPSGSTTQPQPNRAERDKKERRQARLSRYEQVVEMRELGLSIREIARQTGLARRTVMKYVNSDTFPEIASRLNHATRLDPFDTVIQERVATGVPPGRILDELHRLGYKGSMSALSRYIRNRLGYRKERKTMSGRREKTPTATPRTVAILMVQANQKREENDRKILDCLTASSQDIAAAGRIAGEFASIIRERRADAFGKWQQIVHETAIPELLNFASSLEKDKDAVIAGITLPWSNGPTEGHINRLKTMKRQMYGRAGFQMLRHRLLAPQ